LGHQINTWRIHCRNLPSDSSDLGSTRSGAYSTTTWPLPISLGKNVSPGQKGALRWVALVVLLAGRFMPPLDFHRQCHTVVDPSEPARGSSRTAAGGFGRRLRLWGLPDHRWAAGRFEWTQIVLLASMTGFLASLDRGIAGTAA
ncbi:MAG TPA: hypothetical protein VGC82_09935, partial [Rhodopila sp.]